MNELVIIGGGVCRGDLTERMLGEIERADCLFIQTADMPTAQEALLRRPRAARWIFALSRRRILTRLTG